MKCSFCGVENDDVIARPLQLNLCKDAGACYARKGMKYTYTETPPKITVVKPDPFLTTFKVGGE